MIIFDLMKLLSLSLTLFSMEFVTQIGTYHNKSNCAEFMIDVCHFDLINCVLFCFILCSLFKIAEIPKLSFIWTEQNVL